MRCHEVDKSGDSRISTQPTRHRHPDENAVKGQVDPLVAVGRSTSDANARAQASILNHATASHPSRASHSLLRLQRSYGNRYVQRVLALARQGEGEAEVAPEVESAIARARGGGQALDSGARLQMESAFGADFGGVRIHTGSEAEKLNREVSAIAFTTGRDIFFREGTYNPASSGGRELLAHELTHVVQQGGASAAVGPTQRLGIQRLCPECEQEKKESIQRRLVVGQPDDQYEHGADRVAKAVDHGLEESAFQIRPSWASASPTSGRRACSSATAPASRAERAECRTKRLALQDRRLGGERAIEPYGAGEQVQISLIQRQFDDGGGGNGFDGGDSLGLGLDCGLFNGCALVQDPDTGLNTCSNRGACKGTCQLGGLGCCCKTG